MVLDKGEIVEYASPGELLADPNSIFAQMAANANLGSGN
jgi:ABC-type multidrug transport system fused ATPase/permease subunit